MKRYGRAILGIYGLAAVGLLFYVEQVWMPGYLVKSAVKILVLFVGASMTQKRLGLGAFRVFMGGKRPGPASWKKSLFLGAGAFGGLIAAYGILKGQIDLAAVSVELAENLDIDAANFAFVGIYLTLFNSAVEEFFFRGFLFLNLAKGSAKDRAFAYAYSSVLFSVYHMGIFKNWFEPKITFLALAGLLAAGLLFNWMDEKEENVLSSWAVHAFGDAAIVAIGLRMFSII